MAEGPNGSDRYQRQCFPCAEADQASGAAGYRFIAFHRGGEDEMQLGSTGAVLRNIRKFKQLREWCKREIVSPIHEGEMHPTGPTHDELWPKRQNITAAERISFQDALVQQRTQVRARWLGPSLRMLE